MVVTRRIQAVRRLDGGFVNDDGRPGARPRSDGGHAARTVVGDVVERRHVEAALRDEPSEQVVAVRGVVPGVDERRHEHLALAGGNHVGERRQRLGVHERHGAADDDERIAPVAIHGARLEAGEPEHGDQIRVVPLEGHRKGEHVEVAHGRLGFERDEGGSLAQPSGLTLRPSGQEHPLAHDAVIVVQQPVHRLESEVGHRDEVGVRKRQGHAQPAAVRLADDAHLAGEHLARDGVRVMARGGGPRPRRRTSTGPGHGIGMVVNACACRRRTRRHGFFRLYLVWGAPRPGPPTSP